MYGPKRRALSQNFLYSRKLVNKLVRRSSLCPKDTIFEIGPGKGIITEQLLHIGKKVIAVEIDTELFFYLQKKFVQYKGALQLVNKDFLQCNLPRTPYKVFANIPFSIEGKIIRKLLMASNPPEDCYLVVRQDLAERLGGFKKECQFSIFYKPWFTFQIVHYFNKFDYEPAAQMDTVLFRFTKREYPFLHPQDMKQYMIFVGQGFGGGKNLKYNLKSYFSYEQMKRLAKEYSFDKNCLPSNLKQFQWINLFKYAKKLEK